MEGSGGKHFLPCRKLSKKTQGVTPVLKERAGTKACGKASDAWIIGVVLAFIGVAIRLLK